MKRPLLLLTFSVFVVVAIFFFTRNQASTHTTAKSPAKPEQLEAPIEKPKAEQPACLPGPPVQPAHQPRKSPDESMAPAIESAAATEASAKATTKTESLSEVLAIDQQRYLVKLGRMHDWDGFFKYLDAHGLDINDTISAERGGRVYEYLLINFDRKIAERLLDMGIDLNPPGQNRIEFMLKTGGVDEIRFVMDHYPETLKKTWYKALSHAVMRQDTERINYLITEIADITPDPIPEKELEFIERTCDKPQFFETLKGMGYSFGMEAATHAVQGLRQNVLEYHVKNGVDLRDISVDGNNAMDLAIQHPKVQLPMIQYLESQGLALAPRHLSVTEMYISEAEKALSTEANEQTIKIIKAYFLPNLKKTRDYIKSRIQ